MTQSAVIFSKVGSFKLELPSAETELLAGVAWGAIDAFPAPAYWLFQVFERRMTGGPPAYRLGKTLAEELGACLLGGHGIPASVGIAAYRRLLDAGVFALDSRVSQAQLATLLSDPLDVNGRKIRYRFAGQKARYLEASLQMIKQAPVTKSGRQLRDWLIALPGIGFKTASWIARNWLDSNDVAIIDIHILRFGQAIGLFDKFLKIERDYLSLEAKFLELSAHMDVRPAELDAVVWHEMANSPLAVRKLDKAMSEVTFRKTSLRRSQVQRPMHLLA
jgi:N-glycosylase/DNA lyase